MGRAMRARRGRRHRNCVRIKLQHAKVGIVLEVRGGGKEYHEGISCRHDLGEH